MSRILSCFLALWLTLPFFAAAQELPPTPTPDGETVYRALLMGCDNFLSQPSTTPSSYNNVRNMAEALTGGTMAFQTLVTHPEGVSTTGEMAALILDTFSDADEDDVSYFYLSTHGLWEEDMTAAQMVLLLSDGQRESAVSAYMLRTMFDQIPGKKVLIIDACHAGAMLGKGVSTLLGNVFQGEDYTVICSSGGAEESWFWSGDIDGEHLAGAGYFSGALSRALSVEGGFAADDNHDGAITLSELKRYLLSHHGASTVRTYPENSDEIIFSYDPEEASYHRRRALIEGISYESDVLTRDDPTVYFSFNVVSRVQLAYQLVYHRGGRWDFDNATLLYDNDGEFSPEPMAGRTLSLGLKERAITIEREDDSSGYVLLQLLTIERGIPSVASSRVLCVPPDTGDPALAVNAPALFAPEDGEELTFSVAHLFPCELTITIEDMEGHTVRRLSARQGTRPERLSPQGSSFTWDGRNSSGDIAGEGLYCIRVRAYVNGERYEFVSDPVMLLSVSG
ncbi:MAG: caspase family protein [Clostridiales bacterium]|nr:caspase family protein [Clostridiales bacterium]